MFVERGKLALVVDVAVVGGGIAGLSAAWESVGSGASVTVFESTDRVGGKLRTETVAGTAVDVGAESMLGRRPEVQQLLAELRLEPTPPAQVGASIWNGGHGSRLTLDHDTAWSRVVEAARGDVSRATLVA